MRVHEPWEAAIAPTASDKQRGLTGAGSGEKETCFVVPCHVLGHWVEVFFGELRSSLRKVDCLSFKEELRQNHWKYVEEHEELRAVLNDFAAAVLVSRPVRKHKPEKIEKKRPAEPDAAALMLREGDRTPRKEQRGNKTQHNGGREETKETGKQGRKKDRKT
ncbi:UNVERIFIED_CONTAM: hypothetical protein HHA_454370 [Hammondia hammondi]|eukprot:XP_008887881.1 hypothetical protein HHA_454370 [Hammondia hammondi]